MPLQIPGASLVGESGTAPSQPPEIPGASLVEAPAIPGATKVGEREPAVDEIRSTMESTHELPSDEHLRKIFEADKAMGVDDYLKGALQGVKSIAGEGVDAAKEMLPKAYIPGNPRTLATGVEALTKGTVNLVDMARRTVNRAKDAAKENPVSSAVGAFVPGVVGDALSYLAKPIGEASDEEKFQNYKNRVASNLEQEKRLVGHADENGNITPGLSYLPKWAQPYPKGAQFFSNFGDVTSLASLGATAVPRAMVKGATKGMGEAVAKGVAKGVEKTGEGLKVVGRAPADLAHAATEKVLGEGAADALGHVIHGGETIGIPLALAGHGGPITQAAALAKTTEKTGEGLENLGKFAGRVAGAEGQSQWTRLSQVARDGDAPLWMRKLASGLDRLGAGAAAEGAAGFAGGAAKGAAIGTTLGAVSGENPEEAGRAAGLGLTMGTLGHAISIPAQRASKVIENRQADLARFVKKQTEQFGTPIEALKRVDDSTMLAAASLDRIFEGKLDIRFLDNKNFQSVAQESGASAFFDPNTRQLYVNTESAGRAPGNSFLHEVGHALAASEVASRPEIKLVIDKALGDVSRLQKAKEEYAIALVRSRESRETRPGNPPMLPVEQWIKNPDNKAKVDATIVSENDKSTRAYKDPDFWIYSEIFAESALHNLKGVDVHGLLGSDSLKAKALSFGQKFLEGLGVKFESKESTGSPSTFFANFDDVIASPELRKMVHEFIKDRNDFISGKDKATDSSAVVTKDMVGRHEAAPLHTMPDGTTGNDFFKQLPDGTVMPRTPKEVKKIEQARADEVEKAVAAEPPATGPAPIEQPTEAKGATPADIMVKPRKTIGGLMQITGQKFGDWFYRLTNFSAETKSNTKLIENAIAGGKPVTFWYQAASSGGGDGYVKNFRKLKGGVMVSQRTVLPATFVVSKAGEVQIGGRTVKKGGNVVLVSIDLTSADKKAVEWQGKNKLELWGGDLDAFKRDMVTYIQNHAEGRPGETTIGSDKRNLLNAFILGDNRGFADKNPLRNLLRGEDKRGIIRSFRIDRIETIKETGDSIGTAEYNKKVLNLSPARTAKNEFSATSPFTKIWITPDGKTVNTQKSLHVDWLGENADSLKKKYKFDVSKYPLDDTDKGPRLPALNKGFARVNYDRAQGRLTVEANAKNWSKQTRDAVFNLAAENLDDIYHMSVTLLNEKGDIVRRDSTPLFQLDEKEKLNQLPLITKESLPESTKGDEALSQRRVAQQPQSNRNFSPDARGEVSEEVRKVADEYAKVAGIKAAPFRGNEVVNEERAKKIADAYAEAKHNPEDPAVKESYKALGDETVAQWKAITDAGYTMEPWTKEGQPYKNSAELRDDIAKNKHLYFYPTEEGFGSGKPGSDHPLLAPSGIKAGDRDLPINDIFRAVHDFFGHAKEGYEWGPRGEYNAYLAHSRMYSDRALPAMAAETLGQNSWVNFGPHLRDEKGNLRKKGEPGYLSTTERPFAEQKATILPKELVDEATPQFSPDEEHQIAFRKGWIDPEGKFHSLGEGVPTHEQWAAKHLNKGATNEFNASKELYKQGWIRFTPYGSESAMVNTEGGKKLSPKQKAALEGWASMDENLHKVIFDNGNSYDTLWVNPDRNFSPEEEKKAPVFYSQLTKVVENLKQDKIPAAQLAAIVRNPQNSIKADEIKWSGLDDFLKGKQRVTKQEVLDYLKKNQIEIKETTLHSGLEEEPIFDFDSDGYEIRYDDEDEPGQLSLYRNNKFLQPVSSVEQAHGIAKDDFIKRYGMTVTDETKYSDYKLPGGKNYREILFQLPQTGGAPIDFRQLNDGSWRALARNGESFYGKTDKEALDRYYNGRARVGEMTSPHWDSKNVLAHTRVQDMPEALTNKKVLLVEEIQSDWHQKGREVGYLDKSDDPLDVLHAKREELYKKRQPLLTKKNWTPEDIATVKDLNEKIAALDSKVIAAKEGVADAPFKTTWHELVFKRLLRMAAEEGYDKLAWVNGDTSADRYDLSHHLKEVKACPWIAPGEKEPSGAMIQAIDHQGQMAIEKPVLWKDLEGTVGKDLAKKIVADLHGKEPYLGPSGLRNWTSYEGLDLKVGGEGMRGFYDKILVDYAKNYGKKWGAKVHDTKVTGESDSRATNWFSSQARAERALYEGLELYGRDRHGHETQITSREEIPEYREYITSGGSFKVHAIDITPEMRKSVLQEGQKQFTPNGPKEAPAPSVKPVHRPTGHAPAVIPLPTSKRPPQDERKAA